MSLHRLSDDELIKRCRYKPYEQYLQDTGGCAIAIIVGTTIAAAVVIALVYQTEASLSKDPWWLTLSTVFVIGVAGLLAWLFAVTISYFALASIGGARPSRYHEEARRRFLPPSGSTLKQMMDQLLNEGKHPTWILGFSGHAMPRGGQTSILVQHSGNINGTAKIEIWRCPTIDLAEVDPRTVAKYTCSHIERDSITTLDNQVTSLATKPLTNVFSAVRDGLPCMVLAAIEGQSKIQSAHCNLCARSKEQTDQAVLLGNDLITISKQHVDELFLIGENIIR